VAVGIDRRAAVGDEVPSAAVVDEAVAVVVEPVGARSGCADSTPESTIATVTEGAPRVSSKAARPEMSAPGVPATPRIGCPVLCSPHWSPKKRSVGTAWARRTWLGSA
jgi:hypothetical protein